MEEFPEEIKNKMRENLYDVLSELIEYQIPVRIVIWNNNDWDYDLPDSILSNFPVQLTLDIVNETLSDSYVDDENIHICTYFGEDPYHKILNKNDLVALIDISTNTPIGINNFKPNSPEEIEKELNDIMLETMPKSKSELIDEISSADIPREAAKRSIDAFIKHNPKIKSALKSKKAL